MRANPPLLLWQCGLDWHTIPANAGRGLSDHVRISIERAHPHAAAARRTSTSACASSS
jgi:hypothetical protein